MASNAKNVSIWWCHHFLAYTVLMLNIYYKMHQIPKLKCFSSHLAIIFAQSIEARCLVENEDVVGAAPTGDALNTSEWSTNWLPTKVWLILEVLQYVMVEVLFEFKINFRTVWILIPSCMHDCICMQCPFFALFHKWGWFLSRILNYTKRWYDKDINFMCLIDE